MKKSNSRATMAMPAILPTTPPTTVVVDGDGDAELVSLPFPEDTVLEVAVLGVTPVPTAPSPTKSVEVDWNDEEVDVVEDWLADEEEVEDVR
jgi:hypothetical protein